MNFEKVISKTTEIAMNLNNSRLTYEEAVSIAASLFGNMVVQSLSPDMSECEKKESIEDIIKQTKEAILNQVFNGTLKENKTH